jgi:hypothetical protein
MMISSLPLLLILRSKIVKKELYLVKMSEDDKILLTSEKVGPLTIEDGDKSQLPVANATNTVMDVSPPPIP